jgi:hypothetical protein
VILWILPAMAAATAASCRPGETASCTFGGGGDGSAGVQVCQEESGLNSAQVDQLRQACTSSNASTRPDAGASGLAVFADGPCSHAHALGGCQVESDGVTISFWYYEDGRSTVADIQNACANSGAVYVAP